MVELQANGLGTISVYHFEMPWARPGAYWRPSNENTEKLP
jgi:hypothetical protein